MLMQDQLQAQAEAPDADATIGKKYVRTDGIGMHGVTNNQDSLTHVV